MAKGRRLVALAVVTSVASGCVYYNTFYNAQARYQEALESRQRRIEKRAEDEERYWSALQEWLAAGGSGADVLARLESDAADSLARADSLQAVLIDSLGFELPLSEPDSVALAKAYARFDSTLRAGGKGVSEREEAERDPNPRPRRPRQVELRPVIGSEERLLDACITKCAKVISLYPDSDWRDDAIFLMGKALYEKRYYPDAHTKFVELRRYYGASPFLEEARLYEGRALHAMARKVDAREIWQELLSGAHPASIRRAAGIELAESFEGDDDPAAAAGILSQLLAQDSPSDAALSMRLGHALRRAGDPGAAIDAFAEALRARLTPEERFEATLASAGALAEAERPDEGTAMLREIADDQRHFRDASRALLDLARIQVERGEPAQAIETYHRIIERYPGTNEGAEALLALARLHRARGGDLARAKRTLALLIAESPDSDAAKIAREEQRDLDRYLSLQRDAADAEGEAAERARFLLAEHLLVIEDRPLDSLRSYAELVEQAPDTPWRPRSDLAMAWILRGPLAQPERADSIYRQVTERFPGTLAAAVSAAALGLPVPAVTIPDPEPILAADSSAAPAPAAGRPTSSPLPIGDREPLPRDRRGEHDEPEPR